MFQLLADYHFQIDFLHSFRNIIIEYSVSIAPSCKHEVENELPQLDLNKQHSNLQSSSFTTEPWRLSLIRNIVNNIMLAKVIACIWSVHGGRHIGPTVCSSCSLMGALPFVSIVLAVIQERGKEGKYWSDEFLAKKRTKSQNLLHFL